MKTKERVLHVSLALFNEHGEPNVTTLQIADEMDISPGNLYYHYKNKTEIIVALFTRFEESLDELLEVPEIDISMEDYWLFLHLVFECLARYQFLYKDLVNILQRYERIRGRFRRLMGRKQDATLRVCESLMRQKVLIASDDETRALCQNVVLAMTYWPSYNLITQKQSGGRLDLAQGIYQIMCMVAPYLRSKERQEVERLAQAYL